MLEGGHLAADLRGNLCAFRGRAIGIEDIMCAGDGFDRFHRAAADEGIAVGKAGEQCVHPVPGAELPEAFGGGGANAGGWIVKNNLVDGIDMIAIGQVGIAGDGHFAHGGAVVAQGWLELLEDGRPADAGGGVDGALGDFGIFTAGGFDQGGGVFFLFEFGDAGDLGPLRRGGRGALVREKPDQKKHCQAASRQPVETAALDLFGVINDQWQGSHVDPKSAMCKRAQTRTDVLVVIMNRGSL